MFDPEAVVRRTWTRHDHMADGTLRMVEMSCYRQGAFRILQDYLPNPTRATVNLAMVVSRRYAAFGQVRTQQFSGLGFIFDSDGAIDINLMGNPPFDEKFQDALRAEWPTWGLELDYHADQTGGNYGFTVLLDASDRVRLRLNQLARYPG